MPGIGGGDKGDPPPVTDKGGSEEQQGDPGETVGGDLNGGTPVTAEWYYTAYGITTAHYNMIKYGVLLFALSKVVK